MGAAMVSRRLVAPLGRRSRPLAHLFIEHEHLGM
jgi:hypothetical protein